MSLLTLAAAITSLVVGTPAELTVALKNAKGGERIALLPGNYGQVVVQSRTWWNPVTVESADPQRPATIARLVTQNTTGMTFNGIEFTRIRGSEPKYNKLIEISGGAYIRFNGGSVHGSLNNDPSDDLQGMIIRGSNGFSVNGVAFTDLYIGLTCDDCSNFGIQGNMFTFIGSDAIDIPGARGGKILLNTFRDYRPLPGEHPDGIQCWTTRKPSGCKDVLIFRNTFQSSAGHEFQGIMFGDEDGVGGYDRIRIEYNVFSGTMWNAVSLARGTEQYILNNRITAGPNYAPWFRTVSPVTITGNSAPDYLVEGKRGVPAGNVIGGRYVR
ncbi:right-handed parallel beta-helix repeat-containing protein [Sphingomonas sp.]|uniref:right-handed parallel beta-helix repeat-containing protein n=1 Tax=Sphingomonas sp. TaxID=28214 RepID=UPI002FDB0FB5